MNKILGIDLGATNSAMAVLEGGIPTTIVSAEGDRTTPSVVGFDVDTNGIAKVSGDLKSKADAAIADAKKALGSSDIEAIKSAGEALRSVAYELAALPVRRRT